MRRLTYGVMPSPHIIEGAQSLRRRLKHHRSVADVEETDDVYDIRVRRRNSDLEFTNSDLASISLKNTKISLSLHADIEKAFADGRGVHGRMVFTNASRRG
jgi:hypothetical protein